MAIARQKTRQRELREARALFRRVQRGDRRAFELLYAAYEGRVYRFCHRLTGDERTAATLVELTFSRALADLPEDGLETLDVPAYLLATARSLADERGGEPLAAPEAVGGRGRRRQPASLAAGARGAGPARPRRPSRRRDRRVRSALQEQAVPGLVGTARLRLHAELRLPADRRALPRPAACAVGLCRRHVDGRASATSSPRHVTGCANCRAALFALREAALRYRTLPVPEPPGDSARASPLRSVRSACRRAEPRRASPSPAGAARRRWPSRWARSRSSASASRSRPPTTTAARASPPRLRRRPSLRHSRARRCPDSALALGRRQRAGDRPRRPPPVLHHQRAGTRRRTQHAPAHRARPSVAQQLGLGKSFAPEGPPIVASPPASISPAPPKPKPTPPVHDIPVDVLPPNPPPTAAQAASQTSPAPPPPPGAPPPGQTSST